MKGKILRMIIALPLTLIMTSCTCSGNQIINITPNNGATKVVIARENIKDFISNDWTATLCDEYYIEGCSQYTPEYISFICPTIITEIKISENNDMSNALFFRKYNSFTSQSFKFSGDNTFKIRGLKSNKKYFWQFKDENYYSQIFSFTTEDSLRTICIGGVNNSRDIGGYNIYDENNKVIGRVKQGMIYRSAKLDEITKSGKNDIKNIFNIKCELDLRTEEEASVYEPIDELTYTNISCPLYEGLFTYDAKIQIKNLMSFFANKDNYPIIYHCAIGRDRTGSLGVLLEGLLGMSLQDICREYDISFFASLTDPQKPSTMHNNFFKIFNKLDVLYPDEETLQDQIKKFLFDCGVTIEEMQSIYNIMVEK